MLSYKTSLPIKYETENIIKKMPLEKSCITLGNGQLGKYPFLVMDENKNFITAMPPTYRNSRHKLKDSLKSLRSLARPTSPKAALSKTRSRRKLKLVGRRCPYKTLRLRTCLDKSPYLPSKIKIVKEEQKTNPEDSTNKRICEELDEKTRRTPSGSGSSGGRERAASRRRVGCVLEPPTPADALRRRQWPVSGMHERPVWPRAGASRSPTPPPHDAAAAAADAARRSVHCALHAALAFGAQACQDVKEEMEAKYNKKILNHEKATYFPHVFEQYFRICHQDREYICKPKCDSNSSEVCSPNCDNGSDKESEPLDLSDGSAECDDFLESSKNNSTSNLETLIQKNNLLQTDNSSLSNTTENVSLVSSMSSRKPPFISPLCSKTNLSSKGCYANSINTANSCDVQQRSCDMKNMNDRNVFLVTGHFDTSNTFCITSSTKCDELVDNKKRADVPKQQVCINARNSSSGVQISKFPSHSNIALEKKICDSKSSHILTDKISENFICKTSNFSPSSIKSPNPPCTVASPFCSPSEATNLNKSLQIQEIKIELNSLEDTVQSASCKKNDTSVKINQEMKPIGVSSNPELVIIPISEEKLTQKNSANGKTNASLDTISKLPILIENLDQGNRNMRQSILKIPTPVNQINVDENVSRSTSKTKCTFGDSIECIKKRFVCSSNTIINEEISNDSLSTTCVPYFPTTSEETEDGKSHSQNGTNETNLLKTNIIVEEGEKFLHLFRVSKIEDATSEREIPYKDKQEKNTQHRWKSTLMPKKTLLSSSTSEHNGKNISTNLNQCNKLNKRENKTNITQDSSCKKHICSSPCSTFLKVVDKTGSRNSGSLLERTNDNNFSFKGKEDTIIETLVPVIFHRALHYCMICNASPQDLASYIDTLSPLSIMNWPE